MSELSVFEQQPVVGLFGVCGATTFRQEVFIPVLEAEGISYYNPQVPDGTWHESMAALEADHAQFDVVQFWPVTGETYATGTLSEVGMSIANSLRSPSPLPKHIITMVERELSPALIDDVAKNESVRSRKLLLAHLGKTAAPNVFVVETLEEMLEVGIQVFRSTGAIIEQMRKSNPALRRYMEERATLERAFQLEANPVAVAR